jgi:hypothetical protein
MRATLARPWRVTPANPIRTALRPWAQRLALESIGRWLIRGAIAALVVAILILSIGWLVPRPMLELKSMAQQLALPILVIGLVVGAWPTTMLRRAGELDVRLSLADRLSTAWLARDAPQPMARLQRADALARLGERSPQKDLPFQLRRVELIILAALVAVTAFLWIAPSPMAAVLERQAAEQRAALQAAERVDNLRQDTSLAASLTPEQARQLDELLQRAYTELARAQSERDALSILARTEEQLGQLGNPSAADLEEALAAMSETLTQEPTTRSLGETLQRNEPGGAAEAMQALEQRVDQLSDVQRQALSRALQRASNVGRSDPRTAAALREAARAVAANEPSEAALEEASAALREALETTRSEAALRATAQRLQDLRANLGSESVPTSLEDLSVLGEGAMPNTPGMDGDPLAINPGLGQRGNPAVGEPGTDGGLERSVTGGVGGQQLGQTGQPLAPGTASENVFVPGRVSEGPSDQEVQQQPFTLRGQPRPYREVLSEYAQSGRDYVDRAAVSSSVRGLVKQYFADLEGN